jgi:acyl-[acyl-carrier-protein]-phospholipid O-acyltransferase/long-chain-fatty-acid--[acyl-carrier-protein] ligase
MILPRRFLRTCRTALFQPKVADSSGQQLSGGQLLMRTLIIKRLLEQSVLAADEKNIGILLPPSIPAVLVNAALSLARRIPVNLNYTLPELTINSCTAQAQVRHVLTSRLFLTNLVRLRSHCDPGIHYSSVDTRTHFRVAGYRSE